jgi:hypothetical protein
VAFVDDVLSGVQVHAENLSPRPDRRQRIGVRPAP